jgi:hypothetical protein
MSKVTCDVCRQEVHRDITKAASCKGCGAFWHACVTTCGGQERADELAALATAAHDETD